MSLSDREPPLSVVQEVLRRNIMPGTTGGLRRNPEQPREWEIVMTAEGRAPLGDDMHIRDHPDLPKAVAGAVDVAIIRLRHKLRKVRYERVRGPARRINVSHDTLNDIIEATEELYMDTELAEAGYHNVLIPSAAVAGELLVFYHDPEGDHR